MDSQITTNLEWLATLSIDRSVKNVRKTSIICTIGTLFLDITVFTYSFFFFFCVVYKFPFLFFCDIGPKTNSIDMITSLRETGMNIVRMNFSHGSYDVSILACLHGFEPFNSLISPSLYYIHVLVP